MSFDDSTPRRAGLGPLAIGLIVGLPLFSIIFVLLCVLVALRADPRSRMDASPPSLPAAEVDGVRPAEKREPAPVADWSDVGATEMAGDVTVSLRKVRLHEGAFLNLRTRLPTLTRAEIVVTNVSPARNVRFAGWNTAAVRFTDEHGNDYRIHPFGREDRLYDEVGQSWLMFTPAEPCILYPRKETHFILWFEQIADVAMQGRLSLPGEAVGGSGVIRLQLKVTRDKP